MNKTEFLEEVKKEIRALKKNATEKELCRLEEKRLDPIIHETCIYGLMTGHCNSPRAIKLITSSCKKVINNTYQTHPTFSKIKNDIRMYKSSNLEDYRCGFEVEHLSFLETYILMKDAKTHNVISYLKGETKRLVL